MTEFRCRVCGNTGDHDISSMVTCGRDDDIMLPAAATAAELDAYMTRVASLSRGTYYIANGERVDVPDEAT